MSRLTIDLATMTDADKLYAVALFMDLRDAKNGSADDEVQRDLRRIAKRLEAIDGADLAELADDMYDEFDLLSKPKAIQAAADMMRGLTGRPQ
jgi:hypothetical protein